MTTYIYLVTNCYEEPNKVYIGKTKNLEDRKSRHRRFYGRNINFLIIDQVESLDAKLWKPLETKWIKFYINEGLEVMNIRKEGGSGSSGWTDEQKSHRIGKGIGKNIKISQAKTNHPGISKVVLQYDLQGNFVKEWCSCAEAGRILFNKSLSSGIHDCANGRQESGCGFIWKYKINDDYPKQIKPYINNKGKSGARCIPVIQYDLQGNFMKEWKSAKYASIKTKQNQSDICACCRGKIKMAGGFIWKYK